MTYAFPNGISPQASKSEFHYWTTKELKRDLLSPSLDADTRARIEAEIDRRTTSRNPRLSINTDPSYGDPRKDRATRKR